MMEKINGVKPIRVLVVDDELDFRSILSLSLRRRGYDVHMASNGNEALEYIKVNQVDVVVSDIRMPDGDGLELLAGAKACSQGATPVLLLVTGFDEMTTQEAIQKGADALFSKPLNIHSLDNAIHSLLTPTENGWARQSDQAEVNLSASVVCPDSKTLSATLKAIGHREAFVELAEASYPNVNDTVKVSLSFENDCHVETNGVVRWARLKDCPNQPCGVGIEFSQVTLTLKDEISKLIKRHQISRGLTN